jgi:hypothetical protein
LVFVIPISIVATVGFIWIRSEAERARAAESVAKAERAEAVRQRGVAENVRTNAIAAREEHVRQLKLAKEELTSAQAESEALKDKINEMTENSQVCD